MNSFQKSVIIKALDNDDALTEWEAEFVSSLADLPEDRQLSDKQNEILNRIQQKLIDR